MPELELLQKDKGNLLLEFDSLVADIEHAGKNETWRLADWLAIHVGGDGGVNVDVSVLSERSGYSIDRLNRLRRMAVYFPPEKRADATVSTHELAWSQNRHDVDKALESLRSKGKPVVRDYRPIDEEVTRRTFQRLPAPDRVQAIREAMDDEDVREELRQNPEAHSGISSAVLHTYPREIQERPRIPKDFHWTPERKLFEAFAFIYWAYNHLRDMALSDQEKEGLRRQAEQIREWADAIVALTRDESPARDILEEVEAWLASSRT